MAVDILNKFLSHDATLFSLCLSNLAPEQLVSSAYDIFLGWIDSLAGF